MASQPVEGRLIGQSNSDKTVFFVIGTINNVSLYQSDICFLDTTEWLNDNVINVCAGYVHVCVSGDDSRVSFM